MKSRQGFTLIELLVVVAIISLLVTILMPMLNEAKRLAREVVCASNLRSLNTSTLVYAEQHDTWFPYLYHRLLGKPTRTPPVPPWGNAGLQCGTFGDWRDLLRDDYGFAAGMMFSPLNLQWSEKNGNAYEQWANERWEEGTAADREIIGYTYFFITWLDQHTQKSTAEIDGVTFPVSTESTGHDSNVLWTDMTSTYSGDFMALGKQRVNHFYDGEYPAGLHSGHLDGHVEWRVADDMDGPHPKGNYEYWW